MARRMRSKRHCSQFTHSLTARQRRRRQRSWRALIGRLLTLSSLAPDSNQSKVRLTSKLKRRQFFCATSSAVFTTLTKLSPTRTFSSVTRETTRAATFCRPKDCHYLQTVLFGIVEESSDRYQHLSAPLLPSFQFPSDHTASSFFFLSYASLVFTSLPQCLLFPPLFNSR